MTKIHGLNTAADLDSRFVAELTDCQLPLSWYVRSLLPGDPGARDVLQQANAKIWEKRSEFQPGTNFKAWAFSIARYEVLNYRKQQARDSRLRFSDELEQTVTADIASRLTDISGQLSRRHEALRTCLKKLRQQDRDLLMHRYSHAGTLADYAALSGRSVNGLKVTLHRLRTSLLACIQRALKTGEVTS